MDMHLIFISGAAVVEDIVSSTIFKVVAIGIYSCGSIVRRHRHPSTLEILPAHKGGLVPAICLASLPIVVATLLLLDTVPPAPHPKNSM